MSDVGEAFGTAAEGTLFGQALEPKRGAGQADDAGHTHEGACLNCGTELIGPHCHVCGQKAHLHRTIGAFLHDLLHGALHFEGKTFRTLPLLALRPGELTRRYIEGERARFVSPMALFLFSIFLMFAVFQAMGISPPSDLTTDESVRAGLERARLEAEEERAQAQLALDELPAGDPERPEAEADLKNAQEQLEGLDRVDSLNLGGSGISADNFQLTGIAAIDQGVIEKWQKNPGLMLYKLQANSYKFSWLLIPLSIPFVWLLFLWRRRFGAYDHAVFVTYSIAFMSLLFVALSLLGAFGVPLNLIAFAAMIVPPLHIYKQLRGTYGLNRFSAAWRLGALLVLIMVILVLFVQVLLVLGAF